MIYFWKGEKKIRIGIIGGDKREEVMINQLAEEGYDLTVLAENHEFHPAVICMNDIFEVIRNKDVVIASMANTDQDGFIKSTFVNRPVQLTEDFFSSCNNDTLFLIGIAKPVVKKYLEDYNIRYIELAHLADLAILNAIPTAEGAIKIAIEESEKTLFDSNIITYGLGKVGLSLAWRLKALGAASYAVTRDKAAIARGKDMGIKMITYNQLDDYLQKMDIVFNTVPSLVVESDSISILKKTAIIIDLASAPGGIDFESAERLGIKAIQALGLPGKVAPVTAGEILADIIPDLIIN
ncbi:MAG: dipicolinate synthase subunit DpsA [Halanaerobiales bacterium]